MILLESSAFILVGVILGYFSKSFKHQFNQKEPVIYWGTKFALIVISIAWPVVLLYLMSVSIFKALGFFAFEVIGWLLISRTTRDEKLASKAIFNWLSKEESIRSARRIRGTGFHNMHLVEVLTDEHTVFVSVIKKKNSGFFDFGEKKYNFSEEAEGKKVLVQRDEN